MSKSYMSRARNHFLVLFFIVGLGSFSIAAPITFDFTFTGVQNSAMGIGYITFDDALLPNPGRLDVFLPNPAVLDLSITITGATAGNGTYGIADFTSVVMDTNGGQLDFFKELMGQPTNDDPWGFGSVGSGGDFNLFSIGGGGGADYYQGNTPSGNRQLAPSGVWWFTLATEGGLGDDMILTSMVNRLAVPTMSSGAFAIMAVLLMAIVIFIRRKNL